MSDSKKLSVNLSKTLLGKVGKKINPDYKKNSEFIDETIILYIEEENSIDFIETMKQGYLSMSELNLEIAEFGFEQDVCDFIEYESRL
ncbi:MAG: CopG family transcriptional regulator [Clostridium argentinense]|uniref:CopG family transcriptional regulator n=1 Tax=Clostridium faecium TaxID=2762223 RepID=A0ABR8YTX0_9CLOT|nr:MULTISPECIES: CopG family transcriptional regulator [Clostridium]MBD8047714.1 CopG family transcriptional regulator [Clostridium faecium]MBS5823329.1 CopG family transcriptional regulator [Clostridium argentinense]MDU1348058.1 CopG family transcriptional regulator [Clostridium argentinense]